MKIRFILIAPLLLLLFITCEQKSQPTVQGKSEKDSYYERIPDAPLDLYCHLDNLIDEETRKNICLNTMFNQNGNLTLDLGIVIKENKIDTVEIQTLYFDADGLPQKDTVAIAILSPILNKMVLSEIGILSHLQNADFATRVQWERFCIGYVQVNKPGIMSAIDSIAQKN